jgi:glutamine synthetase
MAPVGVLWGRDNRGAMLRVLGGAGDRGTRIENRAGEPMACPYLYFAAQVHAGLDGVERGLAPPPASRAPYVEGAAEGSTRLPASLGEALDALADDAAITRAFGQPLVHAYTAIKRSEFARHEAAIDKDEWQRREYFSRF